MHDIKLEIGSFYIEQLDNIYASSWNLQLHGAMENFKEQNIIQIDNLPSIKVQMWR